MIIRETERADFERILALNEESVHFLSPLDRERLALLHALSAYHRVAEVAGEVVGFLLAFRESSSYDGANFSWFRERYNSFIYIDRVVIAGSAQGQGIGRALYGDLFAFAKKSGANLVTCEYDTNPPNLLSKLFHDRFGFTEVGTRSFGEPAKGVSMQLLSV
jgi:predicted GNAT superfamily acetyltransferase